MRHPLLLRHRDELYRMVVTGGDGRFLVRGEGAADTEFTFFQLGDGIAEVVFGGRRELIHYAVVGDAVHLQHRGRVFTFRQQRHERSSEQSSAGDDLRAPMPGQITSIFVAAGQVVGPGDPLYALEAMKMETLIKAPAAARVSGISAKVGEQVEGGAKVVELEPLAPTEDDQ